MESFQQISLSPLLLRGDTDTLDDDLKYSGQIEINSSHQNYNPHHCTHPKSFHQNATQFTDLLYLWNDYLKNKFEKKEKV